MSRTTLVILVAAALTAAVPSHAFGWGCSRSFSGSGRFGGSFSHSGSTTGGWGDFSHSGSTSYTNRYGQTYSGSHSGSGTYGYGGVNYHGSYSNSWGGSGTYHGSAYHTGYYGGPSYYGYHGVTYNTTYNNGCCCCSTGGAFAAGMVTGAVTGAAVAAATHPTSTTYVYPSSGVYYPSGNTTVNVVNNSGESMPGADAIGTQSTQLPPGAKVMNVNGQQFFQSGPNWWQMRTGPAGPYYVVVPAP